MRRTIIERNLKKTLLKDGSFARALFEFELEEHIGEYLQSKRADGDVFLFAVTEHTNDVAMLLIDEHDRVLVNEAARARLKVLWRKVYKSNLELLIPGMAQELDNGYLYVVGVKYQDTQ